MDRCVPPTTYRASLCKPVSTNPLPATHEPCATRTLADPHALRRTRRDRTRPGEDDPGPRRTTAGGRRRRGRFGGLPLALKAVVGLVVLAAFLTLADRWAVLYAEHKAADTLKDRLG